MLQCPHCDVPMTQVTVRANPGSLIQLDQCQKCGGVWCDKWELFPIDFDDATRLDSMNGKLLSAPAELGPKTLYCPRCASKLEMFADPILPKEILLVRCRRCDGIWLNRGQLARYKNYQKTTRLNKMGADAVIHKLPEIYQDPKSWVLTGTKGMFAYPQGLEAGEDTETGSVGAAFKLILQTLARMVLGV